MNNSQTKKTTKKIWHRLDSGQISLKDKKTILDTRLKKTDLAFFWISVVWRKKMSIHRNIFTDWLTDKGRDKLFVTFETLHFIFFRHRTKMDTDKNLDNYIYYRLLDRHKTDYIMGHIKYKFFFKLL